ncbi:penicillin amidase [Candidatus Kryptonium thompsonii]|nr:penicillin amidase [Candidatus Kryptonium thompsoni]
MSKLAKFIAGISFTLIVLLIAVIILSYKLVTRSHPQIDGELKSHLLIDSVYIYRDEYGIPHIFAKNEHDLYFALGYVTAQDRLWQMDLSRRIAAGRLSEIFGVDALEVDKLFRTLSLNETAKKMQKYLSEKSIEILKSYSDGVNYFIQTHKGNYPIEFKLLKYEPEEWSITDCLLITRLIAWQLNFAWLTEPVFSEILSKVGEEKFRKIVPQYPENAPLIIKKYVPPSSKFVEANMRFREMFGMLSDGLGSNSWVVSGEKSASGKPMLANDPHLPHSLPSIWYQVHLNNGGLDVVGVCIPGTPGIVIGRNNYIAWGLTNVMLDDTDFYIEKIDSSGTKYLYNGKWVQLTEREEEINVRGKGKYKFKVLSTHRGPIISDVYNFSFTGYARDLDSKYIPSQAVSMQWTGNLISDEVLAFYKINRAKNWEEFKEGLKFFTVPAQNFIYADIYGNIGYYCAGKIPVRKNLNPLLLNPGETSDFDWADFAPFNLQPNLLNPPENFIATANNKTVPDNYPYYISYLWEPESRAMRINEFLSSKGKLSIDDFKSLQLDYFSHYARELTPYIIRAFENIDVKESLVKEGLDYLKRWNYNFSRDDIATTIFNAFLVEMMKNTFEDELGQGLYKKFVFYSGIPLRVLKQLITENDTLWFDDVRTKNKIETRDEIIRESFLKSMFDLKKQLGDDILTWHWGKVHKLELVHPLGLRKPLDKIFNLGPFEIGGAGTTVNNAGFSLLKPFNCVLGPSMRQIVNFSENLLYSVIPAGASGQIMSQFYDNQTRLYLNGEYVKIEMRLESLKNKKTTKILKIVPQE